MSDPLRLYGLRALVTNAGRGIGEAISRTLIKHGTTVLAVDLGPVGQQSQHAGGTAHRNHQSDHQSFASVQTAKQSDGGGGDGRAGAPRLQRRCDV